MQQKQLFGILLVSTIIFLLWAYDTNRISLILGVIRGKPNLLYPATGFEQGNTPAQNPSPLTLPQTFHPTIPNTYQGGSGPLPPALPSVSNTPGMPSWLQSFFDNLSKTGQQPNPGIMF